MLQKVISCAFSPNTEPDDVWLALRTVLAPWTWREGPSVEKVERWFRNYFSVQSVVSFNSGRSALFAILKAFDIGEGDEVLIQAFTCVAVPDAVIWTGARTVFIDIDETLNIDSTQVEKNITKRTKAIIVQHTFGIPAKVDKIASIAKRHNIILLEDCAHSLGATVNGQKVGTFGDAAFFSFGRDKVVSSVWGGVAIINNKSKIRQANINLRKFQKTLPLPGHLWIFQQLLHPIVFPIILRLYDVIIGKVLLVLFQRLRLLSVPVYPAEKTGGRPNGFPAKFPNALAKLAFHQLQKLERFNEQRKNVTRMYIEKLHSTTSIVPGAIYLRFPFLVDTRDAVLKRARKQGIVLGNWYHNTIDPVGVDFSAIGYREGSCPKAEETARHIVNLPTRISIDDGERVLRAL